MIQRIIVLLAAFFACGYGLSQRLNRWDKKYFNVALCGMAAMLLSRIYYLVLILSDGNDEILTVGVLGQASAYLFFLTANRSFLPQEASESKSKKICIPGLFGALVLVGIFLLAAIRTGTFSAWIGEFICAGAMGSAFYASAKVICRKKENPTRGAVWGFNLCICILTFANSLYELLITIPMGIIQIMSPVLTGICSLIITGMMPLLRREMNAWQQ